MNEKMKKELDKLMEESLADKIKSGIDSAGDKLIEIFHLVGIFVIGATIVWSAINEYILMMQNGQGFASLKDILLMFIYLELGAMIGIYFKTHKMPVVFLIFIAITAITRFLVIDMKDLVSDGTDILMGMVLAIFILSITAFIIRYTDKKYDDEDF